jgi:dTDP-4-dehydrorhamnose 3,5-epimerase
MYKCSDFYSPQSEKGLLWSDSDLDIEWPVENPIVSEKDQQYPKLSDLTHKQLPVSKGH